MARHLIQGTSEFVDIEVTDDTGSITDLTGLGTNYTVYDESDNKLYDDESAFTVGMIAYCLIDTTTPSLWSDGLYRLYVGFSNPPEAPLIGPFKFRVALP